MERKLLRERVKFFWCKMKKLEVSERYMEKVSPLQHTRETPIQIAANASGNKHLAKRTPLSRLRPDEEELQVTAHHYIRQLL